MGSSITTSYKCSFTFALLVLWSSPKTKQIDKESWLGPVDYDVAARRVCCREAKSCKRLANTKLKIDFVSSLQFENASR
jgi:hypothetical protein